MKNTFKFFITALSCLGMLVSCSDNKNLDDFASEISIDQTDMTFGAKNADVQKVEVKSNGYWVAVTPEWLTVTPNYGTGDCTVEIAAKDNLDADGTIGGTRSSTITFQASEVSAALKVLQNGDEAKDLRRTYKKVTSVKSGKAYLLVSAKDGKDKAAMLNSNNYGYLSSTDVEISNNTIEMPNPDNGFTFTAVDGGGYTIQQSDGRYLYNTGSYNNFNFSADVPTDGHIFTVELQDGSMKITCTSTSRWFQFGDGTYTTFGVYDTQKALPVFLYEEESK